MKIVLVLSLLTLTALAQTPKPCSAPENAQFDFWVGDWDAAWPGDNNTVVHGTNSIRKTYDGCVIEEHFDGGDAVPLRGHSDSMWNPQLKKWQQTWVDNEGSYLDFTGEFKDGQMTLVREGLTHNGDKVLQRMVFKNITADAFDWSWEMSRDGGKTWQVQWPIHYTRKRT